MRIDNIAVSGIGLMIPERELIFSHIKTCQIKKNNTSINPEVFSLHFNKRQIKKMDIFSALAVSAIKMAFDDADAKAYALESGLFIGNIFGGWSYVEPQLYGLYQDNFFAINPYVATAWFPAAPQGEASILYGNQGYSKTFSSGTLSSAFAIEHAILLVKNKSLKMACCGGVEAPVNSIVLNAQKGNHQENIFLTDASSFFCIEEKENAKLRKKYKFTIEFIAFTRSKEEVAKWYYDEKENIESLVCSSEKDIYYLDAKKSKIYQTDLILGRAEGASFALDVYLAYQTILGTTKKAFITRKSKDGQYVVSIISIESY